MLNFRTNKEKFKSTSLSEKFNWAVFVHYGYYGTDCWCKFSINIVFAISCILWTWSSTMWKVVLGIRTHNINEQKTDINNRTDWKHLDAVTKKYPIKKVEKAKETQRHSAFIWQTSFWWLLCLLEGKSSKYESIGFYTVQSEALLFAFRSDFFTSCIKGSKIQ